MDKENEAMLDRLARRIVSLKLSLPAMLMLEAHLPLSAVLQTALIFFKPFFVPFTGSIKLEQAEQLLSSRENLEKLLALIELHTEKSRKEAHC